MNHSHRILGVALTLTLCLSLFAACGNTSGGLGVSSASLPTDVTSTPESSSTAPEAEAHPAGLYVDGQLVTADPMMTINGEDISFDMYRYFYMSAKASLEASQGADVWTAGTEEENADLAQQLLDYTLENVTTQIGIRTLAKEQGIALTEEELAACDEEIDAARTSLGGDEAFHEALAAQYYTEDVYREMYTTSVLLNKLMYTNYKDQIEDAYVHAQHILVQFADTTATEHADELARAEEILEKVKAGDDFGKLMTEYNEDPGQPAEGYYFTTGQMVEPFEKAAFALKDGETSEIVETSYGYHILKRLPMEEEYLSENASQMLTEEIYNDFLDQISACTEDFTVTYNEHYEDVAPDTLY